jgi:hypothetical protein
MTLPHVRCDDVAHVFTGFDRSGPIYQDFYIGPQIKEGDVANVLGDSETFEDFSTSILALIPCLSDESIRQLWRGKIQ